MAGAPQRQQLRAAAGARTRSCRARCAGARRATSASSACQTIGPAMPSTASPCSLLERHHRAARDHVRVARRSTARCSSRRRVRVAPAEAARGRRDGGARPARAAVRGTRGARRTPVERQVAELREQLLEAQRRRRRRRPARSGRRRSTTPPSAARAPACGGRTTRTPVNERRCPSPDGVKTSVWASGSPPAAGDRSARASAPSGPNTARDRCARASGGSSHRARAACRAPAASSRPRPPTAVAGGNQLTRHRRARAAPTGARRPRPRPTRPAACCEQRDRALAARPAPGARGGRRAP